MPTLIKLQILQMNSSINLTHIYTTQHEQEGITQIKDSFHLKCVLRSISQLRRIRDRLKALLRKKVKCLLKEGNQTKLPSHRVRKQEKSVTLTTPPPRRGPTDRPLPPKTPSQPWRPPPKPWRPKTRKRILQLNTSPSESWSLKNARVSTTAWWSTRTGNAKPSKCCKKPKGKKKTMSIYSPYITVSLKLWLICLERISGK